jgi:ribosomal protein L7/L12
MNSSRSTDTSPAQVRVTGWRVGAQTVSAIQAIREASQLGLADAKRLVERVLAGAPVVFNVNNAESAQELVSALDQLKFDAQLVSH